MLPCIRLEDVILYCIKKKPCIILGDIVLFGIKKYWPYIILKTVYLALNNTSKLIINTIFGYYTTINNEIRLLKVALLLKIYKDPRVFQYKYNS